MATAVRNGHLSWSMTRDPEGNREYKIKYLVISDSHLDGPAVVLTTPGLPTPGAPWLVDNDIDLWASCKLNATVTPRVEKEKNYWWEVEFTFSTKHDEKRCKDVQVDDPLLVPDRISGGFVKAQEEATHDRFGRRLINSAHEQIRGPQVEFDISHPTVKIEQNRIAFNLPLVTAMMNCVNDAPLWGLPARRIRLTNVSWEKKYYGACYNYYQRTLEFEVRYGGFDRNLVDEGSKVLNGHWDETSGSRNRWVLDPVDRFGTQPDPTNPQDFKHAIDRAGNACRILLDGAGKPANLVTSSGFYISIQVPNVNKVLTNTAYWIPVAGNFDDPEPFALGTSYAAGDVVTWDGEKYLATGAILNVYPPGSGWQWLTFGTPFRRTWSSTYSYGTGDVVQSTTTSTGGSIYVEKYNTANFLLLGVPVTF